MASIHFVCEGALNVRPLKHPVYESGNWDVTEEEARQVVGGTLYLHRTKAQRSYFGGDIQSFRIVETDRAHEERVIFTVRSRVEAKDVAWRGKDHGRAWTGGVVDDEDDDDEHQG